MKEKIHQEDKGLENVQPQCTWRYYFLLISHFMCECLKK